MLKKPFTFLAKYVLGGVLPAAMLSILVKKLEGAPKDESEHLDEVLLNAALTAIVTVLAVGATLLLARWLVVEHGVESGPLVLLTAWLAGIAVLLLLVLPAFWTWRRYGFFYGVLMLASTFIGMVILAAILIALLVFFGFGLKLLRS